MFAAGPTWRTIVCFGDQWTNRSSAINFTLQYVQRESESAFKSSVPCVFEALGSLKKGLQAQGARIPNLLSSIDWTTSPPVSLPCTPGSSSKVSSQPATPNPASAKSRVLERNSWRAAGIHHFCTVALGPSERAPTWGHPHFSYGEAFPAKSITQPHLQLCPKCKIYKIFFDAPRDAKSKPSRVPS